MSSQAIEPEHLLPEQYAGHISFDGETSDPFTIVRGVTQGCILAIFFCVLLSWF